MLQQQHSWQAAYGNTNAWVSRSSWVMQPTHSTQASNVPNLLGLDKPLMKKRCREANSKLIQRTPFLTNRSPADNTHSLAGIVPLSWSGSPASTQTHSSTVEILVGHHRRLPHSSHSKILSESQLSPSRSAALSLDLKFTLALPVLKHTNTNGKSVVAHWLQFLLITQT